MMNAVQQVKKVCSLRRSLGYRLKGYVILKGTAAMLLSADRIWLRSTEAIIDGRDRLRKVSLVYNEFSRMRTVQGERFGRSDKIRCQD